MFPTSLMVGLYCLHSYYKSSIADDLTIEFTNMWETAFDVTDTTFNCNVNRSKGDNTTQLYLINHFLDKIVLGQTAPDPQDANVTNSANGTGSLGLQVQTCAGEYGRNPNFMLVDVCNFVLSRIPWRWLTFFVVLRVRWR